MRVESLDAVRRHRFVMIGFGSWRLPFTATYLAWGVWLTLFTGWLLVRWVTVGFDGIPVYAGAVCVGLATLAARWMDHDRPARALATGVWQHATVTTPRTVDRAAPRLTYRVVDQ
jgi:hypothetical protein